MPIHINDNLISDELIELCYTLGLEGLASGEVPVGCVFVHLSDDNSSGEVIAKGHNRTNDRRNAISHAEMVCIDSVVERFGPNLDQLKQMMSKTTVLLTLEPCLMCVRALRLLTAKQVLFGARNERFGGFESVYNVSANELITDPIVNCYQVLDCNKSIELLQMFYKQTNESAPKPHRKTFKNN